jgi:hypothetical protein
MTDGFDLMLTALLVTAAACLGSTGLSWMLVQQSRDANQALLEQAKEARVLNRELLVQNETANKQIFDRLAALASPGPAAPAKSMEWNPVKFRLVKNQAIGPPAEGFEVRLRGHLLDTAKSIEIVRKTGTDGIADMGLLRPGRHEFNVVTPWRETRETSQLTVLPGQELVEEIICPAADREEVAAAVSFDWPQDLRDNGFWLICRFDQATRDAGGSYWRVAVAPISVIFNTAGQIVSPPHNKTVWSGDPFSFAVNVGGPDGRVFEPQQGSNSSLKPPKSKFGLFYDEQKLDPWNSQRVVSSLTPEPRETKIAHALRPFHFLLPDSPARAELRLPAGRYTMSSILVAEPPARGPENDLQSLDVLGGLIAYYNRNQFAQHGWFQEFVVPFSDWIDSEQERKNGRGHPAFDSVVEKAQPKFDVVRGEPNGIQLPLHPRLVENVRDFLEFTK